MFRSWIETQLRRYARTLLFRNSSAYNLINGPTRYRVLHALRIPHERDFRALPALLNNQAPVVVDVGANVGQSALSVLTVCAAAKIVSFEPNPILERHLHTLAMKFPQVDYEMVALGSAPGRTRLYVPVYRGIAATSLASSIRHEAEAWLNSDTIAGFNMGDLHVMEVAISVRTLDDFKLPPDLVKIDVQGSELAVLEGGRQTIERHRPLVLIETPSKEVCQWLETYAYDAWQLVGRRLQRGTGESLNTFFLPRR